MDIRVRRRSRLVGRPFAARRSVVECIGIGIGVDEFELAEDHPGEHVAKVFVLRRELHVGPDLGAGIAQPHGVDIARVDERVVESVFALVLEVDRGVERVGEAVAEHPGQLGIREHLLNLDDGLLDGFGDEEPVLRRRALRLIGLSRKRSNAQYAGEG